MSGPLAAEQQPTAPASVADSISSEVGRVFKDRRAAVVKVRAKDNFGIRFGSGFFADPAGTIYTHAGIVLKADEVSVIHDGRELPAKVLVSDPRSGIALLKIEANSPFIPVGDSSELAVASPVVMIGYPEDMESCPSFGFVAGFDRDYLGQYFSTTHIRANLPVQRGQGGAPVLNMRGEAVGILVGRLEGGTGCHILPIRAAEKVRLEFVRFGELRPGWVGVQVEDASLEQGGSTARIEVVDESTPAAQAGLKAGDVVVRIASTPIRSSEDVLDGSYFLTAGDPTEIEIVRDGKNVTLQVKPTVHPLSPAREMQVVAPDATPPLSFQ
ncbi:MAG: trypsin-like peptidase domain-containing protein [Terrimicrobiaceae bacterium]|nr:trypsin-like peptidase domain-containing protein [Terrimicrobiaceae bacterium]